MLQLLTCLFSSNFFFKMMCWIQLYWGSCNVSCSSRRHLLHSKQFFLLSSLLHHYSNVEFQLPFVKSHNLLHVFSSTTFHKNFSPFVICHYYLSIHCRIVFTNKLGHIFTNIVSFRQTTKIASNFVIMCYPSSFRT